MVSIRKPDGGLEVVKCLGYCLLKNNNKICCPNCRNKKTQEQLKNESEKFLKEVEKALY